MGELCHYEIRVLGTSESMDEAKQSKHTNNLL